MSGFRVGHDKPTDLIWLQTSFLGDIVLTTAAFAVAKKAFPEARQHLITTPVGAVALKQHSLLESLHVFHKQKLMRPGYVARLLTDLRQKLANPERTVFLQAHKSFRSGFLAARLGFPTIVFAETNFSFRPFARVMRTAVFHEAMRNGLLLEPLGVTREDIAQAYPVLDPLPLPDADPLFDHPFFHQSSPLVLIAPGSVWGTKRWLPESFTALAQRILDQTSARILFVGGKDEQDIARQIAGTLPESERWMDACGRTSLDDLRRIYPLGHALVSNDSSAIHYASAFHVPTVAVFGATASSMGFGPLAPRSKVCELTDLTCRPCSLHGPQVCPLGHFRCMRDLSVDEVWRGLAPLL